ncbi:MAG: STAS domain-containing protein [Coriobacteriia bacterium]|nr:STAS domain-containing protein [Coriobacteriia bacterium]
MPFDVSRSEDASVIAVHGSATVREAGEFREALLSCIADGSSVTVDLTGAASIDAAFAQMLLSARLSSSRAGVQIVVEDPSGLVAAAFPTSDDRPAVIRMVE